VEEPGVGLRLTFGAVGGRGRGLQGRPLEEGPGRGGGGTDGGVGVWGAKSDREAA
jgi:hypothetical protein